jgi:hypothetical protein
VVPITHVHLRVTVVFRLAVFPLESQSNRNDAVDHNNLADPVTFCEIKIGNLFFSTCHTNAELAYTTTQINLPTNLFTALLG